MDNQNILTSWIDLLATVPDRHSPRDKFYQVLKKQARSEMMEIFSEGGLQSQNVSPSKALSFPFFEMGNIDSTNLFDIDELIIFAYYKKRLCRYKNISDIGANIGLHSVMLDMLSSKDSTIHSYEPDPVHFSKLTQNLLINQSKKVDPFKQAVSYKQGTVSFTRVLGNTTGSHISGQKKAYGELESFDVETENFNNILQWADFIKMDVENFEAKIIENTKIDNWNGIDVMMEVGSEENASKIFSFFSKSHVGLFSQKNGWQKVKKVEDMPKSYKDGSLFISSENAYPWIKNETD